MGFAYTHLRNFFEKSFAIRLELFKNFSIGENLPQRELQMMQFLFRTLCSKMMTYCIFMP